MRISDWSSDVCSSDLVGVLDGLDARNPRLEPANVRDVVLQRVVGEADAAAAVGLDQRGRAALAELQPDQRLDLLGQTGLAVLADRGIGRLHARPRGDRLSVLLGKSVEARVDIGGR